MTTATWRPKHVAWMFSRKGQVVSRRSAPTREAAERGPRRRRRRQSDDGRVWEIVSAQHFETVRDAVKALGVEPASAEIAMIPQTTSVQARKPDDAQLMELSTTTTTGKRVGPTRYRGEEIEASLREDFGTILAPNAPAMGA